jgi:hypothetical protein
MKLSIRDDGTAVILDGQYAPYHVVHKDIDPYNRYDLDEVLAYANGHPDDVLPEGSFEEDGFWYPPEPEPIGTHKRVRGAWVTDQELVAERLTSRVAEMCNILDNQVSPQVLLGGFSYQGIRIQADPVAQQNATAFLTAAAAGVQIPFPVQWRTKANDIFLITDLDALKVFSNKMLLFVQTVFHARWQLKDALRAATTLEQAEAIYESGKAQMWQIGDAI